MYETEYLHAYSSVSEAPAGITCSVAVYHTQPTRSNLTYRPPTTAISRDCRFGLRLHTPADPVIDRVSMYRKPNHVLSR